MGIWRSFGHGAAGVVTFVAALTAASVAQATPPDISGDPYIVVLSDAVPPADVTRVSADLVRRHGGAVESVYREGFKGFSARLPALAASGMRRDVRVASVEALADPPASFPQPDEGGDLEPVAVADAVETKAAALDVAAPTGRPSPAAGRTPRLRRVRTPAADRYRVVLAPSDSAQATADALVAAYGFTAGPVETGAFAAQMAETEARVLSRDARVAYVEEQSIAATSEVEATPRRLPGSGLRRVAHPLREHYRVVLRASVRRDELDATLDELMRAYDGRRRVARSDDPRAVVVEISETGARALSDDFRVELVEEQPTPTR
jgi:hypothetical protein